MNMSEPFKPSNVRLFESFPPLVDTFGKTEIECAVFYVVRTLTVSGDEWMPLRWTDIRGIIAGSMAKVAMLGHNEVSAEDGFVDDLAKNPFARPDFQKLVDQGSARWLGEDGEVNRPLELTDEGRERLRKWVRK